MMISLDQILLLEQKVESAVAKIAQLNAENAALRSKCTELTNALSAKSEQFSSFQTDQNKIEESILKALDRLNTVENTILGSITTINTAENETPTAEQPAVFSEETDISTDESAQDYDIQNPDELPEESQEATSPEEQKNEPSNQGQFDIF
jgi:hypothetical protein